MLSICSNQSIIHYFKQMYLNTVKNKRIIMKNCNYLQHLFNLESKIFSDVIL